MHRWYWIAFAACAAAAIVPLCVTGVLPMTDLPSHMAQIAIWKHYTDPCFGFSRLFAFNWATPYLLGYVLMRILAIPFTVSVAAKITVAVGIVAMPLAMRVLLSRGPGDTVWLSLLGFPLAFGYSFYWGFLNFWIAIPLGVLYVALLDDGRGLGILRTILMLALVVGHGLMFVFCAGVTVAVAIVRRRPAIVWPVIPAAAFFAFSVWRLPIPEQEVREGILWLPSLARFGDFPSYLVANAPDLTGLLLIAAIALIVIVTGAGLTRDPGHWAFAVTAAGAYFAGPYAVPGGSLFYGRFAVFVAVAVIFLFREPRRAQNAARTLMVLLVIGWMGFLTIRFHRFGKEAREFDPIIDRIPVNRGLAVLDVHSYSEHVPGPVFWHFGALYQVRKGGVTGWSFSNNFVTLMRYRRGAELEIRSRRAPVDGIDWPGVLQYDYIAVRGRDVRQWMARDAPVPLPLAARSGQWWLFETPHAHAAHRDCKALAE